jgi:DNA helicase HerA-like ATPase
MNDHNNPIYLGLRAGYGEERPFSLSPTDRRYHTYIIGQTGTGKSTLLKHILMQDIQAGRGVGLIDPHGDLAGELLDCIPRSRTEDVVYFNPGDYDYPIAWNLLKVEDPVRKHLMVSGIVGAFKSIWRDSWGPRLEYIHPLRCRRHVD